MNNERVQSFFLLALLIVFFVFAFLIFKPFLVALALAGVFAVIFQPVYRYVLRQIPRWPSLAAGATMLVCLLCILIPLSILSFKIAAEAQNLYQTLSNHGAGVSYLYSATESLQQTIREHVPGMENYTIYFPESASVYVQEGVTWLARHLGDAFSSVTSGLLNLLVFLFAFYYLLRDGTRLKETIVQLSPLKDEDDRAVFARLELAVNSIIKGNLTIALIQGIEISIGFTIFGVPNPVLWGAVGALSALIPGVGTSLVLVPAIIYLYFFSSFGMALGLTIWGVLAVGLIDNFLGPKLVGRGARLHPLVVLLSVLGGVAFFGPVGVFLGPLSISILFALLSIYGKPAKNITI